MTDLLLNFLARIWLGLVLLFVCGSAVGIMALLVWAAQASSH